MRRRYLLVFVVLLTFGALAQDWEACKPDDDYSFNDVKAAVHRITSSRMYSGWDEKTFARSGDLVAVAVLKTLDDSDMASLENARFVLLILRNAFDCPQNCVKVTDDRRPRMTLLLLEHLNEIAHREITTEVEEARRFVLQQTSNAKRLRPTTSTRRCLRAVDGHRRKDLGGQHGTVGLY